MEKNKNVKIICHPEFISGSVHSEIELNLSKHSNSKMLKQRILASATAVKQTSHVPVSKLSEYYFSKKNNNETLNLRTANNPRQVQHDKKFAFTLAEVLITLGIIGVVAALTIPTLVANYQTKSWNTAAKVFEQQLDEALKVMNSQQVLSGYKTTEKFVDELQKHMKINKVCTNDKLTDCITDSIYWEAFDLASPTLSSEDEIKVANLKTSADIGVENYGTNVVGLQFANGAMGLLSYNPQCRQDPFNASYDGKSCISMVYDVNGYSNPNTQKKDIRGINAKLANCTFKAGGACFDTGFNPKAMSNADCEKVKDNLGIKECAPSGDYWAGAASVCGHISKLPNDTQLKQILDYIYSDGKAGFEERANQLGLTQEQNGRICVWGNSEISSTYATYGNVNATSGVSVPQNGYRLHSTERAVCIKD